MTGKSMTYLFSSAGKAALKTFVHRTTLFAFDLDGTLAPIVADPGKIAIPDDVRNRLIELDRMAPVAIITGRSRKDALLHLGFTPGFLVGNHGAEGLPGREAYETEYVHLCRGWKEQLHMFLENRSTAGIVLEDKGSTLSLHYRSAHNREWTHKEILTAVDRLVPPPRPVSGKFVENLVPMDASHKGDALLCIMQHLGCSRAIFIGDDETDEDVFRLSNDNILGVRVGMSPLSSSRYYLRNQDEIGVLLDRFIETTDKEIPPVMYQ